MLLSTSQLKKLETEHGILHLLYHRNHNQHHVAVWWRHLNMVKRAVRKILRRQFDIENAKKIKAREKLQAESAQIARHLLDHILPTAYYEFNSIIALGQFINLGLALVGSISAIHSVLLDMEGLSKGRRSQTRAVSAPLVEDHNDLGEEIEQKLPLAPVVLEMFEMPKARDAPKIRDASKEEPKRKKVEVDLDGIFEPKKKKVKSEKKEKKEKKKKKRSAMDDIFG